MQIIKVENISIKVILYIYYVYLRENVDHKLQ